MEVHAPHGSLHSWKDFWIHLGTIAVGLLIALALEAGAEQLHRLHERHQLEEDFRDEAAKNKDLIAKDLVFLSANIAQWDAKRKIAAEAREADGRVTFTLPATHDAERYVAPSRAVWATAREGTLIDLLPAQQARTFSRVDYEAQLYEDTFFKSSAIYIRIATLAREFAVDNNDGSSVWRMPAGQRDALVEATAEIASLNAFVAHRLQVLAWADEETLAGARTLDEMMEGMRQQEEKAAEQP